MKNTLQKKRDFYRLYRRGKEYAGGYTVVYAKKNGLTKNRIGIIAGKAVGNAVVRNRAKRLIREAARLNAERIKTGYDMVIIARGRCAGQDFSKVQRDLLFVLRKLELLKDEKNTDMDD